MYKKKKRMKRKGKYFLKKRIIILEFIKLYIDI